MAARCPRSSKEAGVIFAGLIIIAVLLVLTLRRTPVEAGRPEKPSAEGAGLSPGCYSGSLIHTQPRDSSCTGRTTLATDESPSWATTRRS